MDHAAEDGLEADADIVDRVHDDLIEPEVLPLLHAEWRARAGASCLAALFVLAGVVVVPAGATAALFLLPALAASWLGLGGIVAAMVLATALLVAAAGRGRRALVDRWSSRRLRAYNEAESRRLRALLEELRAEGAEGRASRTAAFVRGGAERAIRLAYLAEYRSPVALGKEPPAATRSLATTRVLGLALFATAGADSRRLASFLAPAPESVDLDPASHRRRFAELPADELVHLLEVEMGLRVEDRGARYVLPRAAAGASPLQRERKFT